MSHFGSFVHSGRSFDSCIAIPAPNYEKQQGNIQSVPKVHLLLSKFTCGCSRFNDNIFGEALFVFIHQFNLNIPTTVFNHILCTISTLMTAISSVIL